MKSKALRIFFLAAPFAIFTAYRISTSIFILFDFEMVQYITLFSLFTIICLIIFQFKKKDRSYFSFAVLASLAYFSIIVYFSDSGDIGNAVSLSGIIAFTLKRPDSVLYFSLFMMAFIPPIIGRDPFTYYFAKPGVPEMFWETRLFKVVNNIINYFWALLFGLSFGAQFFHETVFSAIIPVILQLLIGAPVTAFLIPFLQKKLAFVEMNAPREFLQSAEQAIIGMPYVFNRKFAGDMKIVIQFIISGSEKFEGYLDIKEGNCVYHEGKHPSPSMTMNSPADVYLKVARNEIRGSEAFLKNLILIEGDLSLAPKMEQLFGVNLEKKKPYLKALFFKKKNKKYNGDEIRIPKRYFSMEPGAVKKVLLIQASPRKTGVSKTDILAQAFLEGCKRAGAEIETVYLSEKKINSCTGCYTCWTKTPGKCIFNDDVPELMQKENDADLVVYASPLYIFGIISTLKKYFDRMIPVLEPYLIENVSGKTSHPARTGWQKARNVVVMGVCGFPEVSHFDGVSAYFHHVSNVSGDEGLRIIAEIYRPASEILNNGFYSDETERVLNLTRKAGEQIVTRGEVEKEIIRGIETVDIDISMFREQANTTWDLCITNDMTLAEAQKEFFISSPEDKK